NRWMDKSARVPLISANTAAAPVVAVEGGRRCLRFDGTDDRMWGVTGTFGQPFTVVMKVKLRDISTVFQGLFWTYDTPGATVAVSTSGRLILNAGSAVQT